MNRFEGCALKEALFRKWSACEKNGGDPRRPRVQIRIQGLKMKQILLRVGKRAEEEVPTPARARSGSGSGGLVLSGSRDGVNDCR